MSARASNLRVAELRSEWSPRCNQGWIYVDQITTENGGDPAIDFYVERYPHSDRETWLERFVAGQIRSDETVCSADMTLQAGMTLRYHRPGWDEPAAPRDFRLLHEDDDLVAVDKPSGLQVLPAAMFLENTLLHVVRERIGAGVDPVHRLGRGTSGIVVFARTDRARRQLSQDLSEGRMKKRYVALVQGNPAPSFSVDQAIGLVDYTGFCRVFAAVDTGKPSISHVRVIEPRPETDEALVEVEIPTGRPHQIRIHLAAAGHPLVGEPLYERGGHPPTVEPNDRPPLPGDLGYHLHAMQVGFTHPTSKDAMLIECEPPDILRPRSAAEPPPDHEQV